MHPPGIVFQKPFSTGEPDIAGFDDDAAGQRAARQPGQARRQWRAGAGTPHYQKGLQTFVWKAEDENGDDLTYDVLYRREGDTAWKHAEART